MQPGYEAPDDDDLFLEDDDSVIDETYQAWRDTSAVDDYAGISDLPDQHSTLRGIVGFASEAQAASHPILPPTVPTGLEGVRAGTSHPMWPAVVVAVGMASPLTPSFIPSSAPIAPVMDDHFEDLSPFYVLVESSVVVSWEFPEVRPIDLTHDQCQSMLGDPDQLGAPIIIPSAIDAWRPIERGVEAIQFVAHTARGGVHAYLWYGTTIRKVIATGSARYICKDYRRDTECFSLLSGTPASDILYHDHKWLHYHRPAMSYHCGLEGICILMDTIEYRVKARRTINLRVTTSGYLDSRGYGYNVSSEAIPCNSIIEVDLVPGDMMGPEQSDPSRRDSSSVSTLSETNLSSVDMAGRLSCSLSSTPRKVYPYALVSSPEQVVGVIVSVTAREFMDFFPEQSDAGPLDFYTSADNWHSVNRGFTHYSLVDIPVFSEFVNFIIERCTKQVRVEKPWARYFHFTPGLVRCINSRDWVFTTIPVLRSTHIFVRNYRHCATRTRKLFYSGTHDIAGTRYVIFYGYPRPLERAFRPFVKLKE